VTLFRHPEVSDAMLLSDKEELDENGGYGSVTSSDDSDSDSDGFKSDGDSKKSGDGKTNDAPNSDGKSNDAPDKGLDTKKQRKAAAAAAKAKAKAKGKKRERSPSKKSTRKKRRTTHFSPTHKVRTRPSKPISKQTIGVQPKEGEDTYNVEECSTKEELMNVHVFDLKAYLRDHDSSPTGVKAVLVDRILRLNDAVDSNDNKGESKEDGETKELLKEMLRQQTKLIEMMQRKNDVDEHVDVCAITAKKTIVSGSSSANGSVNGNNGFVSIRPKNEYINNGENDMERYMRVNMDMVRLIEENASLRRDRLLHDMVNGVNKRA
jgi:hypothetical protein